ncbi:unnamed protein product [Caenorhabditis sp. 36 PRJEB53466]|nr:unnamed protein product [Caenorhabditis sp. 36 PRJEB53466]
MKTFWVLLPVLIANFVQVRADFDSDSATSSSSTTTRKSPSEPTDHPAEDVVIPTRFGYVRGIRMPTRKGPFVDYFKGVPFAEKPQRLKKSVLVHRWNGVYDAKSYSKKCIANVRPVNASEFSEDCLYLNIVRPSTADFRTKLPVVIFVHGGAFQEGFGNDANCEAFGENFVTQNMIVVSIQYRLAMLGFMSLGCSSASAPVPCNLGLWDMVTAFEFVNRTIADFGGDPDQMTLMGHSAGAMAVSLHALSPISGRFFQKFIQMSASSWCLSRFKTSTETATLKILNELNCNTSSAETIFECVNSTSLDAMYTAQIDTTLWPQFGDDLLPDVPEKLVNNTRNKPLLTGIMTLESLYFTYLKSSPQIFPYIRRSTVEDYINSTIAVQYGIQSDSAFSTASQYYLDSNVSDTDYGYYMWQRTKLDSNVGFDIPMLREVRARMTVAPDLFLYYFPYFNPAQFDADFPVKATYHCQEFPYIWGIYKDNYFDFDADDHLVSQFLIDAFVNFIKNGNPTSSNFTWPKIDSEITHTVIQPVPTTGKHLFQDDYKFWDQMAQQFQLDIITGLPVENQIETTTAGSSTVLFYFWIIIIIMLLINA